MEIAFYVFQIIFNVFAIVFILRLWKERKRGN